MLTKSLKLLLVAGAAALSFSPAYAGPHDRGGHDGGGQGNGHYDGGRYDGNHDRGSGHNDGDRGGQYRDDHRQYYVPAHQSVQRGHNDHADYDRYNPYYGGYDPYYGRPRHRSGGFLGIRLGGKHGRGHHGRH